MSPGERLYSLYQESVGVCCACDIDSWSDLNSGDREAWERTAERFVNEWEVKQ